MPRASENTEQVISLPLPYIKPNPRQARKYFNEERLLELVQTIQQSGVIQPITVRPLSGKNQYEIVVGERRWRACLRAQLRTIPAIVRNLSDREALELSSIENLQREDLTPTEEGQAVKNLLDLGRSLNEIAACIGKSPSYLQARVNLLELPKDVQVLVDEDKITMAHAEVLKDLPNVSDQQEAAKMATHQKLTATQLKARTQHKRAQRMASPPLVRVYGNEELSCEIICLQVNLERFDLDPNLSEASRRSLAKQISTLIKSLEKVQQRVLTDQASKKR